MSDLIRREDVEKAIQGLHIGDIRFFAKLRQNIDAIPSAEAERTWKVRKVEMENPKQKVYKCRNCNQFLHRTAWSCPVNYCSSCGARLEWDEDA